MQLNDIIILFKGMEQTFGLPLWVVLTISGVCFLFVVFYGFYLPIQIISIKRKLYNLFNVLKISQEETQRNLQRHSNTYRWKS